MRHADDADYQAILINKPDKTKSLLNCLEQTTNGIRLYMNANKTEFMYFKQEGAIFTLWGKPLKLVDQYTYLGSNILSTDTNVKQLLAKS